MTVSEKATIIEQSVTMYSLNDGSTIYWKDWAEHFIKNCKEHMGWEVAVGPGTSLGVLMPCIYYLPSYTGYWYRNSYRCSAWDCDWTQPDGIYSLYQSPDECFVNGNESFPLYTGWFKDFLPWPSGADENGIDQTTGRFDFIIYTGTGTNGEKIGFRVKYPVCSIGYPYRDSYSGGDVPGNYIYGVPSISLYSSTKGDIENYYPSNLDHTGETAGTNSDFYEKVIPAKGYVSFFYNEELNNITGNTLLSFWGKTDINETLRLRSYEKKTSPLWSLELQTAENFTKNTVGYEGAVTPNRLFKNFWYKFNKFHFHFSKSGDTAYMYVSDDINGNVGFKIITTTLESGEKAIILPRRQAYNTECLCECAAVTGNLNNNPSQPDDTLLIKLPTRPYRKIVSQINRFSFSRMLIPTQISLCTDLYYVTKRDIDDTIGNGQYVIVKDKQSENHYFRVIPFGSRKTYEVSGDNTTYLAFPVLDPPKGDNGE